jgi:MFS transporter, Spinster family, sphingosine-1-phosphate transporter
MLNSLSHWLPSSHLGKFVVIASLCVATFVALASAFGAPRFGVALSSQTQFALIAIGGFLMTCTAGPVSAIVIDLLQAQR